MNALPHFSLMSAETPDIAALTAQHDKWQTALKEATSADQALAIVGEWDHARRAIATWEALVDLRFNQDTRNPKYKADRDFADEIRPKLTDLEVRIKRCLLEGQWREVIASQFGSQSIALWEADLLTFDPKIEADLVSEAKLQSEYTELTASARYEFQGEKLNLSGIMKFRENPDRQIRHDAEQVRWQWFADNRVALDRIYADQVALRTAMARKLGFENYIGMGYKRMKRVDYSEADVDRFRQAVRTDLVPLCAELRKRQAARLGIDKVRYWDEAIADRQGNPAPQGDHDWMIQQAHAMFAAVGPEIAEFFRLLDQRGLMDLKNREGKAPGGFCTAFPNYETPFIYANFNGTKGDVEVFTHEVGHAFQCWQSRKQPLLEYLWPTYESCEIHSMGLEFLTWPQMDLFFGKDGDRFRRIHLEYALLFIPYGVAVDHFQHLVYNKPDVSADERHKMWQEVERLYLPWRDYGDLPHVASGGMWQFQRHIYLSPFYYIDYTLAQTCALQLWVRSQRDYAGTVRDYTRLCGRGGEAPFQELAKSTGLTSPFADGCLKDVVSTAWKWLERQPN